MVACTPLATTPALLTGAVSTLRPWTTSEEGTGSSRSTLPSPPPPPPLSSRKTRGGAWTWLDSWWTHTAISMWFPLQGCRGGPHPYSSSSRVAEAPHTCNRKLDLSALDPAVQALSKHSVAVSTRKTYDAALRRYSQFCFAFNVLCSELVLPCHYSSPTHNCCINFTCLHATLQLHCIAVWWS